MLISPIWGTRRSRLANHAVRRLTRYTITMGAPIRPASRVAVPEATSAKSAAHSAVRLCPSTTVSAPENPDTIGCTVSDTVGATGRTPCTSGRSCRIRFSAASMGSSRSSTSRRRLPGSRATMGRCASNPSVRAAWVRSGRAGRQSRNGCPTYSASTPAAA